MDENIQDFPESPFEPWRPVSPDKFKGRKKDISKITRYLPKVVFLKAKKLQAQNRVYEEELQKFRSVGV